jgi:hypothetical protein
MAHSAVYFGHCIDKQMMEDAGKPLPSGEDRVKCLWVVGGSSHLVNGL